MGRSGIDELLFKTIEFRGFIVYRPYFDLHPRLWIPIVGVTFLGISFSMVASSLWPMIPLIVPISQVGTAFGTIQSIQNLGIGKDLEMTTLIDMET